MTEYVTPKGQVVVGPVPERGARRVELHFGKVYPLNLQVWPTIKVDQDNVANPLIVELTKLVMGGHDAVLHYEYAENGENPNTHKPYINRTIEAICQGEGCTAGHTYEPKIAEIMGDLPTEIQSKATQIDGEGHAVLRLMALGILGDISKKAEAEELVAWAKGEESTPARPADDPLANRKKLALEAAARLPGPGREALSTWQATIEIGRVADMDADKLSAFEAQVKKLGGPSDEPF